MSAILSPMAQRVAIWTKLREWGLTKAVVSFSGSGDSGQIDDVVYYKDDVALYGDVLIKGFDETIIEASEEIINSPDLPDWYNDDGGNGTMDWIVGASPEECSIEVTVNQAVVEYVTTALNYHPISFEKTTEDV